MLAAAGCGSASAPVARPQTVELGWHENCGTRDEPIPISTRRLVVANGRWSVDLSFRNGTRATLNVIRPHHAGGTYFGLEPFKTASLREVRSRAEIGAAKPRAIADRFRPAKPGLLRPGESWSGSFAGPGALPAGTPLRVVLGRFVPEGKIPRGLFRGFLCISRRVVRLKPVRGAR